ncbi:MAG: hypothetical protein ACYTG0_11305 [Planctomycetota bacterium]|jgi:YHS domain-containing protein
MRRDLKVTVVVLTAVVLWAVGTATTWAHCGVCGVGGDASHKQAGHKPTDVKKTAELPLALEGYCAVCIHEPRKWVKGSPEHEVVYDGRRYWFPGEKQKAMFVAHPQRYAPVLGGDCTVCLADGGKQVAGNVRHSMFYEGRLFLFPGEEPKAKFAADPDKYANVDLAMEGNCPVCLTEMEKTVPGKPEFSAHHKGLRYLFPSDKQRTMFLAAPEKYTRIR